MKIWILIFSAALFVGGTCLGVALQPKLTPKPANDNDKKPPAEASWNPGRHGPPSPFSPTRFSEDLKLTEDQNHDLDAILSDSQEEMQALGRAMRAAQDKSRERILAILTPEQKAQFDSLLHAERQKRTESDVKRTVDAYQKILQLSDEQAKDMRAALLEARGKRHEGFKGGDYASSRKASRAEQAEAMKKILKPEQFKHYQEVSELERY